MVSVATQITMYGVIALKVIASKNAWSGHKGTLANGPPSFLHVAVGKIIVVCGLYIQAAGDPIG